MINEENLSNPYKKVPAPSISKDLTIRARDAKIEALEEENTNVSRLLAEAAAENEKLRAYIIRQLLANEK